MGKTLPEVSVIIPCRNEERFIGPCLDSVMANDYPQDKFEILIVDGMSSDGTRAIVLDRQRRFQRLRLLDNPKRITPCAFNIGIREAKGAVIVIMGAHSFYAPEYLSKCVKNLEEYEADNVGGLLVAAPREDTPVGRAIAGALSHPFGVGNSSFRVGSREPKWVDTVFGGCYRRRVFDTIGLFNEELKRSQDIEFNRKLRKAGGKILFVPEIISTYYAKSSLGAFTKDNFSNGIWAIYPLKFVHRIPVSWRHLVPLVFVLGLLGSAALSVIVPTLIWLFLSIVLAYLAVDLFFSSRIALKKRDMKYLFLLPVVFASLHVVYGAGSLWAAIKLAFSKRFWKNRVPSSPVL